MADKGSITKVHTCMAYTDKRGMLHFRKCEADMMKESEGFENCTVTTQLSCSGATWDQIECHALFLLVCQGKGSPTIKPE